MNPAVKQVGFILQQELKYLSGLYPYDLKKFFDARLLHCSNIFAFLRDAQQLPAPFMERLVNLVAGIELLSIGTNHHNFNIGDFIKLAKSINSRDSKDTENNRHSGSMGKQDAAGNLVGEPSAEMSKLKTEPKSLKTLFKSEQKYTVDLLFGDIFYSRAVIYLLKYGDHFIFESILDSLKAVHKNRLSLHQKLSEVSNNTNVSGGRSGLDFEAGLRDLIEDNMVHVLGVNSLYKTSFLIGWGLFADIGANGGVLDSDSGELQFPYEVINDFILSKALNDLAGFFKALPGEYYFLKDIKYMSEKKSRIRNRFGIISAGFKQDWLKANFKSLGKLYL